MSAGDILFVVSFWISSPTLSERDPLLAARVLLCRGFVVGAVLGRRQQESFKLTVSFIDSIACDCILRVRF